MRDPWGGPPDPTDACAAPPGPGRHAGPPADPWSPMPPDATDSPCAPGAGVLPGGARRVSLRRAPAGDVWAAAPGPAEVLPGGSGGVATLTAPAPPLPPRTGRRAHARAKVRGEGRGFLARAAAVTAGLTAAGALLGLVRDQILAGYFGAGAETDAFLVAWTVPEFASTLLIEDAMALILVPAFSRALARRPAALAGDPVRELVRGTLPRLTLVVGVVAAFLVAAAPAVVDLLAPGLSDRALAVDCVRLTATCVLTFALVGYCSAALRAHHVFLPPATIYVAYNVGIIGAMVLLREPWGVRSAAAGVAVGGVFMVLVQLPALLRELRTRPGPVRRPERPAAGAAGEGRLVVVGLIAPVVAFSLIRQSQTLIERFLAAPLPSGAISHLNYAQKIAQMPMILSLMLCTVSFPMVARALAAGDPEGARRRVERDLLTAAVVVLAGAAVVIATAPRIVELLFQRGEFGRADTVATAAVMRVYALGLLGQTMVGALVRCYFSAARPLWYPAAAMAAGLAATAAAGVPGAAAWGAVGIAAANAAGITLTAVLLLRGAHRQTVPVRSGPLGEDLLRLAGAAAGATGAGWLCSVAIGPAALAVAVAAFAAVAVLLLFLACSPRAPELPLLPRFSTRRRRTAHGRPHRAAPPAADASPVGGDVPLGHGHR